MPAMESNNDTRAIHVGVWFAQSGDDPIPSPFRGSKIDKENLIVVVVNNSAQRLPAANQVGGRELALEDGKLKMVSKPAHHLEDLPQPLVIRYVVAD